ncbi:MAG: alpha/beta fold hydrolase [Bauldia sp.]
MPTITTQGATFSYDIRGPSGAPALVFIDALGATRDMWREQIAALAGPYRCIAYDANGHGETPPRAIAPTIDALADDLASFLDGLGVGRAVLVGASIGGMTAQAFASRFPERVERLVLISTSARTADPTVFRNRAADVRAKGLDDLAEPTMGRWFTPGFAEHHADRVEDIRKAFLRTDREAYARMAEAVGALDLLDRLPAIEAPTLVIAGAEDKGTPPENAIDIRSRIPNATLVIIPGGAHMVPIECAAAVSSAIAAFLALGRGSETHRAPATFEDGLANRRAVLGDAYVDRALASSGELGAPWQDYVTRIPWGEAWGDPALPWKTRSLLTLALVASMGREDEFRLHVHGALRNGATKAELQALIRHVAAYAGAAAGNNANRWMVAELADGA